MTCCGCHQCCILCRKTCEESNPNINVILEQAHALEERGQIISRLIGEPFRKAVPSKGTKQDGDDSNAEDTSRIHDLNSSRHSILLDDQQDDSLLFDLVDESIIKSDGLQSNAATPWKTKSNVLVDVAMQTEAVEGDIFTLQQCKVELEKSKEQDEDYILSMNYIQYQLGEVLFAINHTQDSPGSRGLLGSAAKQYQMSISLQQFDPSQHISMTKQESLLSLDGVGYAGHASNTPTSQKKRQASTVNNSKNNDFVNKYLFDDSTPSTPSSSFYQKDQHVLASGEKSLSINIDKSFAEPVIDYEHIYEEQGEGVEDAELRIRPAVEDGDENDEQLMQNMSCRTVHLHEIYPDADDGKESEEEEDDKVQLEIDLIRKQQSDEEYDKRDPLTKMKSFAPTAAINPLLRAKSSRSAKSTSSTSSPADQPAGSRTSSAVTTPADNPRKQALPPLTPSQLEVSYHGKLRHDVEQLTKEIDEEIERILWSQQHTSAKKTTTTPKRVRLADRTHDISHDFSELDLHKNTVTWDTSLQRDVQDMETWMDYEIEQITVGFQDVVRKHYYHPDHSTTSATDLSASAYLASPASRTHRVVDGDEEKKDSQYLHMHSTRGRDNVMNEGYNDLVEEAKDLQIRELQLQISSLQLQQTKSEQQHQTLQKQHQVILSFSPCFSKFILILFTILLHRGFLESCNSTKTRFLPLWRLQHRKAWPEEDLRRYYCKAYQPSTSVGNNKTHSHPQKVAV